MAQTATISSIKREFNLFPNIVGIVTTANLSTLTTADYWTNESDNIELLNNGVWQWEPEDLVMIYYSVNQIGFFRFDSVNQTFISLNVPPFGSAYIRLLGQVTTVGGSPVEVVSVPGVIADDFISVQLTDGGTNNVTIKSASAGTDTITVVFSGDPNGDAHFDFYVYALT